MSLSRTFNKLWEESKAQHRANARHRAYTFRRNFEKKWIMMILLIIPPLRRYFVAERDSIRVELQRIVATYVPQIQTEIMRQEEGFNQWERENSGPSLCGSASASRKESEARKKAKQLALEMQEKINAIPKYDMYFYPIENPTKMVSNPYPGYMTTERARNYCEHLVKVFG
jgi:hypothetical protein